MDDILVRQLRNINFIDAIISILTLQNTLLVVMGSADRQDMTVLASISSAVGLADILFLTIKNMIKNTRRGLYHITPEFQEEICQASFRGLSPRFRQPLLFHSTSI